MASRTLPGLGLNGFWNLGEDGWKDGMDENLRSLSALTQLNVLDRILTASLPGSPTHGMVYIVTDGANANNVALYDTDTWIYLEPAEGWRAYDATAETFVYFNGTAWVEEIDLDSIGGGLLEPLSTATPSGEANAEFEIPATGYSKFIWVGKDVSPATDNVSFGLRCSDNGGSSFGSNVNQYGSRILGLGPTQSITSTGTMPNIDESTIASGATSLKIARSTNAAQGVGNAAGEGVNFTLELVNDSDGKHLFTWAASWRNNSGFKSVVNGCGMWASATGALTNLHFLFNSGNVASGLMKMIGVKES